MGAEPFTQVLRGLRPEAVPQWQQLQEAMRPLAAAASAMPAAAFRSDWGAAVTVGARYLPQLLSMGPSGLRLMGPFSQAGGFPCGRCLERVGPQGVAIAAVPAGLHPHFGLSWAHTELAEGVAADQGEAGTLPRIWLPFL